MKKRGEQPAVGLCLDPSSPPLWIGNFGEVCEVRTRVLSEAVPRNGTEAVTSFSAT